MKKQRVYLFMVPLCLILLAIYFLNAFTKNEIRVQSQELTLAEGLTIRNLMEVSGGYLANEGEERLRTFLDSLFENELIVYIGLYKGSGMSYLLSRYEGYFPVTGEAGREEFQVIESPIGDIFNIRGRFVDEGGQIFTLHIGFDYEFLAAFETAMGRNFWLVAGLFTLIILFVTALILYFDKKFFHKELELEREKQEKERFKELSLLTSEIAHEIKNPLNSIYLSFNALEGFLEGNRDALFYKDAIKGEIQRVSGIIQAYSELSKELRPQIEQVNLDRWAEEFQWMTTEEFKAGGASLDMRVEENLTVQTDPKLLKQVLLNLVKNAVEAGADKVTVEFRLLENRTGFGFVVTDNGRGMDEETAAEIFKPYVSTKTKGMGLGLYIVLRILKSLNGTVRLVSSRPGHTVFEATVECD